MAADPSFISDSLRVLQDTTSHKLQVDILENVAAVIAIEKLTLTEKEQKTMLYLAASQPHLRPALVSVAEAVTVTPDGDCRYRTDFLSQLSRVMLEQGCPREAAKIMDCVTTVLASDPEKTQYYGLTVGVYAQIVKEPDTIEHERGVLQSDADVEKLKRAFHAAATSKPVAAALKRMQKVHNKVRVTGQRAKIATMGGKSG